MRDDHRPKQELIHPFTRMLGYDSTAELQAVGRVLGVFVSAEEQARALGSLKVADGRLQDALFRRKDGCPRHHSLIAGEYLEQGPIPLVVFDRAPDAPNSDRGPTRDTAALPDERR